MISTTRKRLYKILAILFWVAVWECASLLIGEELFLPSPVRVLQSLGTNLSDPSFWSTVAFTFIRIISGFLLSLFLAAALAVLSSVSNPVRFLSDPLVKIIRATPVASVIILVLVWVSPKNLSAIISYLMVFPIVYTNILEGLDSMDGKLTELARSYRMRLLKRAGHVYLPQLIPYISSAVSISSGLAWKSGIAAEVIGIPRGSIGERVYMAKIYLSTPDLFAWTVVVVILAFVFERIFLVMMKALFRRITG